MRFSRKSPSSGAEFTPRRGVSSLAGRPSGEPPHPPMMSKGCDKENNCKLKKPHPRGTAFVHCQRNYIICGAAGAAEPAADAAHATSPAAASTTPHNAAGNCSFSSSFSSWHWPASAHAPYHRPTLRGYHKS